MKLLNFKQFANTEKLSESLTEFGFNHISATGIAGSGISKDTTQPNDPQMSTDGWDRHKNNIINSQNRLADVLQSIFKSSAYTPLGNRYIDFKLETLKINRMYRNNNESVDVYLEFTFEHEPESIVNGVFRNWGNPHHGKFECSVIENNHNRLVNTKVVGLIKTTLEKWFKPPKGDYLLLKDYVDVWNQLGTKDTISKGDKIRLDRVQFRSDKPIMFVTKENTQYKLTGNDFWYFNWWFEPIEKPHLSI